jgi:hypothetical protein
MADLPSVGVTSRRETHYLNVRRSLGETELARKPRAGLAKRLERAHVLESLGHRALFLLLCSLVHAALLCQVATL